MTERVLSTRDRNRSLLARQLLLRRSRLSLTRALEQVAGLQAQYAPSAYIRLWSSLERFAIEDLTRALERRRAIQATLMRSTIHIVSARDYWLFADGVRRARQEHWNRVNVKQAGAADRAAAAKAVRALLRDRTGHRDELVEACRRYDPAGGTAAWGGLSLDLVRVPPSGTWDRRRADLYARAETWLGPSTTTEAEGLEHLLRRYLSGFGPARLGDAASWAGVPVTWFRPVVERIELRVFRDEEGKELLDVPRAPLPDGATRAPARFLGTWDATLLVHARRTQILPERFRPLVFNTKMPHSSPTFLVDGAVAGTWRVERSVRKATLVLQPFEPLPRRAEQELRHEAERLVRFVDSEARSHTVLRG